MTFADDLESYSGNLAVIDDSDERLSYQELASRADQFAGLIAGRSGLLLIEAENAVEPLVAYLGALRSRHPCILLGPDATAKDGRIAQTFRPSWVYRRVAGEWRLGPGDAGWGNTPGSLHPDLAVLLSTSGSTGSPKLVRLSHGNIHSNAAAIAEYLEIGSDDRAITSLPIHYSYGLSVVNSHLAAGATLLLTGKSVVSEDFWAFADVHGATSMAGVPYTYELLDQIGFRERANATFRCLTQAGGRLPSERVLAYARWARERGARFFVMYGQTEATARMAYLPPDLAEDQPGCIGVAIPGGAFRIVDDEGLDQSHGLPGELVYHGPNVMMGYAEIPADLALGQLHDELKTGDIAVRDNHGLYRIVGRKSRFCKIFGLRIALDEAEDALRRIGVEAAVAGSDERLALCIIGEASAEAATDHLAKLFGLPLHVFAAYHAPSIPRLESGKVDYVSILADARPVERYAGDSATGETIAVAMSRVLGRPVTTNDSFSALGGDSLSYVQMAVELERHLGTIPAGWENMAVRDLERTDARPASERRAATVRIDSEIILRALAIIGVVLSHIRPSDSPAAGGAVTLFMLAGYSLARFNRSRLLAGDIWPVVRSFATSVIIPYYIVLAIMVPTSESVQLSWASVLLYSNFKGINIGPILPFWFIHTLWQCLLIFCVPFLFPVFRRYARVQPWRAALLLFAVALGVKFTAAALWSHEVVEYRTPDAILYLLILGWLLYHANTGMQKAMLMFAAIVLAGLDFGWDRSHGIWLMSASAVILFLPRIQLPRPAYITLTSVAAASFWIYLTHMFVIHITHYKLGIAGFTIPLLTAAITGIACQRLWLFGRERLRQLSGAAAAERQRPAMAFVRRRSPPGE